MSSIESLPVPEPSDFEFPIPCEVIDFRKRLNDYNTEKARINNIKNWGFDRNEWDEYSEVQKRMNAAREQERERRLQQVAAKTRLTLVTNVNL